MAMFYFLTIVSLVKKVLKTIKIRSRVASSPPIVYREGSQLQNTVLQVPQTYKRNLLQVDEAHIRLQCYERYSIQAHLYQVYIYHYQHILYPKVHLYKEMSAISIKWLSLYSQKVSIKLLTSQVYRQFIRNHQQYIIYVFTVNSLCLH